MRTDPDAFVIWVEAEGEPPGLRGRIEHVQSSERARFDTAEELLRFLGEHLRQRAQPGGSGQT